MHLIFIQGHCETYIVSRGNLILLYHIIVKLSYEFLYFFHSFDIRYTTYDILFIFSITFKNPSFFEKYFKKLFNMPLSRRFLDKPLLPYRELLYLQVHYHKQHLYFLRLHLIRHQLHTEHLLRY